MKSNSKPIQRITGFIILVAVISGLLFWASSNQTDTKQIAVKGPTFQAAAAQLADPTTDTSHEVAEKISAPVSESVPETVPEPVPEVVTDETEATPPDPVTGKPEGVATTETGFEDSENMDEPHVQSEPGQQMAYNVTEAQFMQLEESLNNVNYEMTPMQFSRLNNDGWYQWGVLNSYAKPDAATRSLGGIAATITKDGIALIDVDNKSKLKMVPLLYEDGVFGTIGLRGKDEKLMSKLKKQGNLQLWYLFRAELANNLYRVVVQAFECQIDLLDDIDADTFRSGAKLRAAVDLAVRANQGKLGILRPTYFDFQGDRIQVNKACMPEQSLMSLALARSKS